MKINLLILLLGLAVFIPFAFSNWGLTESSEARYAEISREMYTGANYLHPKLLVPTSAIRCGKRAQHAAS